MMMVQLFETENMPDDIFASLRRAGVFVEDGTGEYVVGAFVFDLSNNQPESDVDEFRRLDEWFIGLGAVPRERVLVHHGMFLGTPEDNAFLFKEEE